MWCAKTKDGKWKYTERYKNPLTDKTHTVSITYDACSDRNKKNAQRILNNRIEEICRTSTSNNLTLSELIDKYLAHQEQTVKLSTYSRNRYACGTILSMFNKDILINRLTAAYVRDTFLASGKDASTLNELRCRFRALMNYAYESDYLEDISWLKKLKRFHETISRKERIQDKFIDERDVDILLNTMQKEHMFRWAYLTSFMILSGMRIGEILALKKNDVNLQKRTIQITKTYDFINRVETNSPKTDSSNRTIYIQDEFFVMLKQLKLFLKEDQFRYQYNNEHNLFFPGSDGGFLSYYSYNKYLRGASERSLNRSITTHALRHTHCSLMFAQGMSLDAIARRLGHANSKVTREIYLHVTERLKEKDNQAIKEIKII